jgi:thiamine biosynthesis protein ThiS
MRILLNGEPYEALSPATVRDLLEELGLDLDRVAVELNRSILKRSQLSDVCVREGDALEVVTFVGGG